MGTFDIGMIGLAVMGRSLALNMADKGFRVIIFIVHFILILVYKDVQNYNILKKILLFLHVLSKY